MYSPTGTRLSEKCLCTLGGLKKTALKVWRRITQSYLKSLYRSMPWLIGWLKIWSYLNLVSLAGEMIPFPSQMITLKSGGNQMKFTHGRNPPSFPIENVQEGFWPLQLPIFYNGNGVGLRPWVNFVWSSPDFRVTIYDGNGHISPARKTRFGFDHVLSHPIGHSFVSKWP